MSEENDGAGEAGGLMHVPATAQPDFGKYNPRTFTLPLRNWAGKSPEHTQRCHACGDWCTGGLQVLVDPNGNILDHESGSSVGKYTRPACTVCYQIWIDESAGELEAYLAGELRRKITELRERERHTGPAYHRVISDRLHGRSREGVFVDAWRDAQLKWNVLREIMILPCKVGDAGAFARELQQLIGRDDERWRSATEGPLTDRECAITAAAIQWLGTNIGFDWLQNTLAKAGFVVSKIVVEKR